MCNLFAAGLVVNPCDPCDLAESRKLLEMHAHRWSDAAMIVKSYRKLPPDIHSSRWDRIIPLGRNMLASISTLENSLEFLHIPPVGSRKSVDRWSTPLFSFKIWCFAVYPPDNVLAVCERKEW